MLDRIRKAEVGVLATVTPEGLPHVVPCCFAFDGKHILTAVDHKPKTTRALARLDNVRVASWASLLVDHYEDDWDALWWVRVAGPAAVVSEGPAFASAIDALRAKYHQYEAVEPEGPVISMDAQRWQAWP